MPDLYRDIYFKDLFKGINMKNLEIPNEIQVPNEFYQRVLDHFLERSYLNRSSKRKFLSLASKHGFISWQQMTRLPIHPDFSENYDLLSRWQGVLSTLHAWNYRLLFLLLRHGGETHLYIGTTSLQQNVSASDAIEQIKEAAFASMPGMDLKPLDAKSGEMYQQIAQPLGKMRSIGAVTGIPSFREGTQAGLLQTLDQLAFGIRDEYGYEKDYAMLVIADPMQGLEISGIIEMLRKLGSEIHSDVNRSVSETKGQNEQKEKGLGGYAGMGIGRGIGSLAGNLLAGPIGGMLGSLLGAALPVVGSLIGAMVGADTRKSITMTSSSTVNMQYLDKFAQYAEECTDMHVERLKEGRNLGYWNTGVYVLGNTARDVVTVMGMLRSIYSGKNSYLEPIRLHLLREDSGALPTVRDQFDLIPLVNEGSEDIPRYDYENDVWHILGKRYQYLSTPMNTAELSLATSLPRRDVPGLRLTKTAVRFANNPAPLTGDSISLGHVMDMGVEQSNEYKIDPNALVRHCLVAGTTGGGKSTTCKRIITQVMERKVPVTILEPAKDDYIRWAIEQNKTLPEKERFLLFMPGVDPMEYGNAGFEPLRINLFEPAAIPGVKVDLLSHCENMTSLLNSVLPSEEVIPILIEETIYETIAQFAGSRFQEERTAPLSEYPDVNDLRSMSKTVMDRKTYAQRNKDNFVEILNTRFEKLSRGSRGRIINVRKSTDYANLFDRRCIINFSRLAGSDKALMMSLLLLSMYEYRSSAYAWDAKYRSRAQKNELLRLMVVEEAHNVLGKPEGGAPSTGNPQRAAADLFQIILKEIRSYGQRLMIVDQSPMKLIPDVLENTNYKICHRITHQEESEIMAASMALRPDQYSMIPSLCTGQAVICGDMDDAAAWVKIRR